MTTASEHFGQWKQAWNFFTNSTLLVRPVDVTNAPFPAHPRRLSSPRNRELRWIEQEQIWKLVED